MGKLRVFEAFAGYGSQSMALKRLGINYEVVAISEIDKYAIKAYEAIHGETTNLGDISKIRLSQIPEHDLFTYSFPCTDISVAGKQEGLEKGSGTRSSLLWECQRIIRFKRPKYLLLENVKNLVGKKHKENFDDWLKILESYGYKNYWKVLNAKDFGVPQNRERVFVVSILGDENYEFPSGYPLEKRLKDILESEVDEKYYLSEEIQKRFVFNKTVQRLLDKLPKGDEIKITGTTQNENAMGTNYGHYVHDPKGIVGALTARDYKQPKQIIEPSQKRLGEGIRIIGNIDKSDWTDSISRVYGTGGIAPTVDTMQGGHRQPKIIESVPIINATKKGYIEAFDGDGIDLNYPDSETRRGRVQQQQQAHTLTISGEYGVLEVEPQNTSFIEKKYNEFYEKNGYIPEMFNPYNKAEITDIAPTQTTNCWGTTKSSAVLIQKSFRIRKLTPLECWRLMDVSDENFYKVKNVGVSDTQLYKLAGNSIVCNVLVEIFRNLLK